MGGFGGEVGDDKDGAVAEIVEGVGEDGEAVGEDAADDFDDGE